MRRFFALFDDVHKTCAPEKVLEVHRILEEEILAHTPDLDALWGRHRSGTEGE